MMLGISLVFRPREVISSQQHLACQASDIPMFQCVVEAKIFDVDRLGPLF